MYMEKPVMFELFSGSGRISDAMRSNGFNAFSFDYDKKCNADYCIDLSNKSIVDLISIVGCKPDFIWLSPDCTTYSLAQHGIHRNGDLLPRDSYAVLCDSYNSRFADELTKLGIPFIVENPRGFYRLMPFAKKYDFRFTTSYGSYGLPYCKFEDLFSNFPLSPYFKEVVSYKGKIQLQEAVGYDCLKRSFIPDGFIDDLCKCAKDIVSFENRF